MVRRAEELLGQIGVRLDVRQNMRHLSTAQVQLVQVASAIGTGARVLVFDEPTSSLSEPEAQRLFVLIDELKRRGVTMIYVSHRLPEVFRLCDRMSVLRDGKYVGTLDRAEATQDKIVQMMIGRSIAEYFPQHLDNEPGEVLLEVRGLTSPGKFREVSFQIRAGEIVGFAGLVGSGRSEIAVAIFGLDKAARGEVLVGGQPLRLGRVREAMRRGIGLVPEDRKRQGLVMGMSGRANFSLALLNPPLRGPMRMSRAGFLRFAAERRGAEGYFSRLRVKTPSLSAPVQGMSGGNQQKVVLAKWLAREARVLIVDEPTRGVDVGAKAAIHELIDGLARGTDAVKEGLGAGGGNGGGGSPGAGRVGIMLISSELPEVLNLSTRILVMREGRLVGELGRKEASQESVLRLMAGVEGEGKAEAQSVRRDATGGEGGTGKAGG